MGVMSKIFGILGFEPSDQEEKQKSKKHKKVKATYNFKKREQLEKVDNIEGIKVVYPEFLSDGKKYLEYILDKQPLIISIEEMNEQEMIKLIAYLSGACDLSGCRCVVLEKDRYYILLPEGMEIED